MNIRAGASYYQTQIGADYYNEAEDARERQGYYAEIADRFESSKGEELFQSLHQLLNQTHRPPGELPGEALYARVDRRPDGALYPLYSGQGPKNESEVRERNTRDLEGYNLEHVVPKAWFDAKNPMRDDLHHLFTEDRKCNSDRGDLPLREVQGNVQELPQCGLMQTTHGKAFEPQAGKGEAARAILYFITKYPGEVGDQSGEMDLSDLPRLLDWHRQFPVTDYERHRNETIQDVQGNRNPFIDFPELAEKVDFRAGFGG